MFRTSRRGVTILLILASCVLRIQTREAIAQGQAPVRVATPPDGCWVYGTPEPESLDAFTRVEIQALALAHAGERANAPVLTSGKSLPPVTDVAKTINGLKLDRKGTTCAAFIIADYTGSKNENIANVARFLVFAYQQLGKMSDEMLGIILAGSRRGGTRNYQGNQLAQWRVKRQEILDQMTDALRVSLSLLLDESRKDAEGKPDHLILSQSQRDALLFYLRSKFPALANEGMAEPSSDFTKQAALIQSFLAGKYQPSEVRY